MVRNGTYQIAVFSEPPHFCDEKLKLGHNCCRTALRNAKHATGILLQNVITDLVTRRLAAETFDRDHATCAGGCRMGRHILLLLCQGSLYVDSILYLAWWAALVPVFCPKQ